MSTIDNKQTIQRLVAANGLYKDDPQVQCIYTYVNVCGRAVYAIYYSEYILEESDFVLEPELLWSADIGLTAIGEKVL